MKKLILFTALITITISCKKNNPEPEPTPPAPVTSIGAVYQGGIVFQLDADGQHGLIITQQDIYTCKWTNETGSSSTFQRVLSQSLIDKYVSTNYVGGGKEFTDSIVQVLGSGIYAAKVCKDLVLNGYNDWYLPTHTELYLALNAEVITASTYTNKFYWSSYEEDGSFAMTAKIKLSGSSPPYGTHYQKNTILPVRAIRKF